MSQRVEEEVHRLNLYLYPSTLPKVMEIMEEVFLSSKIDDIYNEIKRLLKNENYQGEMNTLFPSITTEIVSYSNALF